MKWLRVRHLNGKTAELAVNKDFEGLFKRRPDGSWEQWAGCSQFKAKTPKEFMRKLRAFLGYQHSTVVMVRGSARNWEEQEP